MTAKKKKPKKPKPLAPPPGGMKRELIGLIPGDQIDRTSLIQFFAKLKGRPCTQEEIDGFNEFGKEWQADIKAREAQAKKHTKAPKKK